MRLARLHLAGPDEGPDLPLGTSETLNGVALAVGPDFWAFDLYLDFEPDLDDYDPEWDDD